MRLHHLAFRTDDLPGVVAFYQDFLGLAIVQDARPYSVWLGLGADSVLMIEVRQPEEPGVAQGTLDLAAFTVTEVERAALRERLIASQRLEGETSHTLYFRDPDGRRIGVSTFPISTLGA